MAPSTARSADAGVTPGPVRSRFIRKASSTSTATSANRDRGTVSPVAYTPSPRRKPDTG